MKAVCPDCLQEFRVSLKTLAMLAESFKRNPGLKFICTPCGKKIEQEYRTGTREVRLIESS